MTFNSLSVDFSVKVAALAEMNLGSAALEDAVGSHDFELIWTVLQKLRKALSIRAIVQNIQKDLRPDIAQQAIDVLTTVLQREGDRTSLIQLYEQTERYRDALMVQLEALFASTKRTNRAEVLEALSNAIQRKPRVRDACAFEVKRLHTAAKVALMASEVERSLSVPRGTLSEAASSDLVSAVARTAANPAKRIEFLSKIQRELSVSSG